MLKRKVMMGRKEVERQLMGEAGRIIFRLIGLLHTQLVLQVFR